MTIGSALTHEIEAILPRAPLEQQGPAARSLSDRLIATLVFQGGVYEADGATLKPTPNDTNDLFVMHLGTQSMYRGVASPFMTSPPMQNPREYVLGGVDKLITYGALPTAFGNATSGYCLYSDFAAVDEKLASDAEYEAARALEQLSAELGLTVSARLKELIALAREDESPETLPSPQSFRSLVDFLVMNRDVRKPGLTLDDEGLVWAEWRRAPDCFAALRFLPDGNIRWTMVTPAPLRKSGRVTWRGDGGADEVRSAIDARRDLAWIVRRSAP